jgi:hypothetical protein
MRSYRPFVAVAALILLGGLNLAAGADKVLVPGEVPLTQDRLVRLVQFLEWSLDVALPGPQQKECSQLLIARWKEANQADREKLIRLVNRWEEIAEQGPERDKAHAQSQAEVLAELGKHDDAPSRLLLRAHKAAQQVLVPGNPKGGPRNDLRLEPLTQGMVDAYVQLTESVLDFSLTEQQGREYQKLLVAEWQQAQKDYWGSPWQARVMKDLAWWNRTRCRSGCGAWAGSGVVPHDVVAPAAPLGQRQRQRGQRE